MPRPTKATSETEPRPLVLVGARGRKLSELSRSIFSSDANTDSTPGAFSGDAMTAFNREAAFIVAAINNIIERDRVPARVTVMMEDRETGAPVEKVFLITNLSRWQKIARETPMSGHDDLGIIHRDEAGKEKLGSIAMSAIVSIER